MERASLESKEQRNTDEFLRSGEQTAVTEQIKGIAETIEGGTEDNVRQIFQVLSGLRYHPTDKDAVFRKRSADQILADGYVTGCTDDVLVFIAIARATGIPTKYIEAIDKAWMKSDTSSIQGHVYAGIFDSGEWRIVDPSKRELDVNIDEDGRVIYDEGLDSWDIGIHDYDSLAQKLDQFRAK